MSAKIIVSYDGTANEDDAIALGRVLAAAPAPRSALAYVRHTHEPDSNRETLAQAEAQELLDRGVELLGDPTAAPPRRDRPLDARGPARARRAAGRRRDRVLLGLAHRQRPRRDRQLRRAPARGRPHGGRDRAGRPRRARRRARHQADRRRRRRRRRRARDRRGARRARSARRSRRSPTTRPTCS